MTMTTSRSKSRLLVHWGNPYMLEEVLAPIMDRLAAVYEVSLVLVDWRMTPRVQGIVDGWRAREVVREVRTLAGHKGGPAMQEAVGMREWFGRFDVFLGLSAFHPVERFIVEECLKAGCRRALFWPHPCNLWMYPWLVESGDASAAGPLLEIGEAWDVLMFFSEGDAAAHRKVLGRESIVAVRYEVEVEKKDRLEAILMPHSIHGERELTPAVLSAYAHDIKIAMQATGIRVVHIRPHPGRPRRYTKILVEKLNEKPMAQHAAWYAGVMGPASGALRDAALTQGGNFVVGSMRLSKGHYPMPKETIGFAGRIGWIEADGSYAPGTFERLPKPGTDLPSAADVVCALA
jgi:hypothetical protein